MKDKLDYIMKRKYAEIEIPKLEHSFSYMKKKKDKLYNVYKVAVVTIFLVACGIAIKIINKKDIERNVNNVLLEEIAYNTETSKNDVFLIKPSETIMIGPMTDIVSIAQLKVEYVAIVKVNKILGCTNYSEIQNTYTSFPITKLEVEVEEVLKGDISGTIQINKPGGIISMSDYEKTLSDEQKEKQGYNKKTEEEKKNTYVEIVSSLTLDMPKVEIGKSYLVFLKNYNEVYDDFSICGFFMKEYDKNTNSIKKENSNEIWEKVEDNILVKQAIEN